MEERKLVNVRQAGGKTKLRRGFTPLWTTRATSLGIGIMFVGQITYYATEVVGLGAALVGTILLASKLFDAVSEMLVGFIVDKTNSKLGKGRPFDLFLIPFWISVVFLFSVPQSLGQTGKVVYVFVLYSLAMSVFQTLLAAAETVYLGRAVESQQLRAQVLSRSGVIIMLISAVASMILPQFIDNWGSQPGGWTKIAMIYAVPMGIIGMVRFIFIKEEVAESEQSDSKKLGLKESMSILFQNKYIFILAALIMLSWIAQSVLSTVSVYYFSYIIGDIGLLSMIGMGGLLGPFFLLLFPLAIRTIGSVKFVRIGLILAIAGNLVKFFTPTNMLIVVIGTIVASFGITIVTMLNGYFILQCIDFGQWKTGKRIEGIPTAFTNFTGQVGNGLASLIVGVVMSAAGYVANATTQTTAAQNSIISLYSAIPAIICIAMLVFLQFFNVEKKLSEIRKNEGN